MLNMVLVFSKILFKDIYILIFFFVLLKMLIIRILNLICLEGNNYVFFLVFCYRGWYYYYLVLEIYI